MHTCIITTKGGRKHVQHFPKDQRTLCFVETPRATILQKHTWEYVLVMRSVQTTVHILEGEEKSYDKTLLPWLILPKYIIASIVNSDQQLLYSL